MTDLNLLGRTIGRFEILSELGRGGMAVVYRARQTDLERTVALKVLPPELSLDQSYIARFRQEARSAAALEHPHIVPIYEVGAAGRWGPPTHTPAGGVVLHNRHTPNPPPPPPTLWFLRAARLQSPPPPP